MKTQKTSLPSALAVLALLALDAPAVTNTAINGGDADWFNASTWSRGIPAHNTNLSARVLIANATNVTFDRPDLITDAIFNSPTGTFTSSTAAPSGTINIPYYLYNTGANVYDPYNADGMSFSVGYANTGNSTLNIRSGAIGINDRVNVGVATTAGTVSTLNVGGDPSNKALLYTYRLIIGAGAPASPGGTSIVNVNKNGRIQNGPYSAPTGHFRMGVGSDGTTFENSGESYLNINDGGIAVTNNFDFLNSPNGTKYQKAVINVAPGGNLTLNNIFYGGSNNGTNTNRFGQINVSGGLFYIKSNFLWGASSGTYDFSQTAGNVTVGGSLVLGSYGNGAYGLFSPTISLTLSGGTFSVASNLYSGQTAGGNETITVDGGTFTITNAMLLGSNNLNATFGLNALGASVALIQNGGSVVVGNFLGIGHSNNEAGNHSYTLNNGNLTVASNIRVGWYNAQGRFQINGGSVNIVGNKTDGDNGCLALGYSRTSASQRPVEFIQTGGSLVASNTLRVAQSAGVFADLTQSGGTISVPTVSVAMAANTKANLFLSGGSLSTTTFNLGSNNSGALANLEASGNASITATTLSLRAGSGGSASASFAGASTATFTTLNVSNAADAGASSLTFDGQAAVTARKITLADNAALVFRPSSSNFSAKLLHSPTSTSQNFTLTSASRIIADLTAFSGGSDGGAFSKEIFSYWTNAGYNVLDGRALIDPTTASLDEAALFARGFSTAPALRWEEVATLPTDPAGKRFRLLLEFNFGKPFATFTPPTVNVNVGDSASLPANIYGAAPVSVEWRKSGSPTIIGTSSTLTIPSTTLDDSGTYEITCINAYGTSTATVTLVVNPATAPTFTSNLPPTASADQGGSLSLSITPYGYLPFTYQWFKDGKAIAGATDASLDLSLLAPADSGSYYVEVTNSYGTTRSDATQVTIEGRPYERRSYWIMTSGVIEDTEAGMGIASPNGHRSAWTYMPGSDPSKQVTTSNLPIPVILNDGDALEVGVDLTVGRTNYTNTPGLKTLGHGGSAFQFMVVGSHRKSENIQTVVGNPNVSSTGYGIHFSNQNVAFINGQSTTKNNYSGYNGTEADSGRYTEAFLFYRRDRIAAGTGTTNGPYLSATTSFAYPFVASNNLTNVNKAADPALFEGRYEVGDTYRVKLSITKLNSLQAKIKAIISGGQIPEGETRVAETTHNGHAREPAFNEFDTFAFDVYGPSGVEYIRLSNLVWRYLPAPNAAPFLYAQPESTSLFAGSSVSVPALIRSDVPVNYQWVAIDSGADVPVPGNSGTLDPASSEPSPQEYMGTILNAPLTFDPADDSHSGNYVLIASNAYGTTRSDTVTVTVQSHAPRFDAQPASASLEIGGSTTLSASAGGSQPVSYQWYKNNAPIPGATDASFAITSASLADTGDYFCVASNPAGSVTSSSAKIYVSPTVSEPLRPVFSLNPVARLAAATGASATLTAAAAPVTAYVWNHDGSPLTGATTPSLTLKKLTATDAGSYWLTASNLLGSTDSSPTLLWVGDPVKITSNLPAKSSAPRNGTLTLSVTATGTQPITYQWYKDGKEIPGATAASFVAFPALDKNLPASASMFFGYDAGRSTDASTTNATGSYYVKITNPLGSVNSRATSLIVETPPSFSGTLPNERYILTGKSATLSVKVRSTSTPTYEWFKDGISLVASPIEGVSGADTATLRITNGNNTLHTGIYTLKVSTPAGSNETRCLVVVGDKPVIEQDLPKSLVLDQPAPDAGTSIATTLSVTATGYGIIYRWERNGSLLYQYNTPTTDSAGRTIANVLPTTSSLNVTQSGSYRVLVQTPFGTVASKTCKVTVNAPPSITKDLPAVVNLLTNKTLSLKISAKSSTKPVTYKWFYRPDNDPLTQRVEIADGAFLGGGIASGSTTASLKITKAQESETGFYSVEVWNPVNQNWLNTNPSAEELYATKSRLSDVWVGTPPTVKLPKSAQTAPGANFTLTAEWSGTNPSFLWSTKESELPLQTTDTLTFDPVELSDAGTYYLTVKNRLKSVKSTALVLSVIPAPSPSMLPAAAASASNQADGDLSPFPTEEQLPTPASTTSLSNLSSPTSNLSSSLLLLLPASGQAAELLPVPSNAAYSSTDGSTTLSFTTANDTYLLLFETPTTGTYLKNTPATTETGTFTLEIN